MKTELELKHLAPYLPYEMQVKTTVKYVATMRATSGIDIIGIERVVKQASFKPMLRPLSKLDWDNVFRVGIDKTIPKFPYEIVSLEFEYTDDSVECFINGETHTGFHYCFSEQAFSSDYRFNQIAAYNEIYRQHGDVNFLIEKGLAIDINTL